jgi:hypothetical protein
MQHVLISFPISHDLLCPKGVICLGDSATALTTMPKAAIQENRDPPPHEYKIWFTHKSRTMSEFPPIDS